MYIFPACPYARLPLPVSPLLQGKKPTGFSYAQV